MEDALYQAEDFFVLRTPLLPFEALSLPWRTLLQRPEVAEAIALASPSLAASLPLLDTAPGTERARKVERSLLRYLSRMAARPTPLGLLAGISVGRLGERTDLRLPPLSHYVRHRHADFDVADAAARQFALEHREQARFRRAQSLRITAESVSAIVLDGSRRYQTVSVEASPELVEALAHDGGELRDELIDAQLFEPESLPPLTGEPVAGDAHVDLIKPAPGLMLDKDVARRALQLLEHRLSAELETAPAALPSKKGQAPPVLQRSTALDAFRAAFAARYGEQEVPLLEALDEELGIGLGHFPPRIGLPSVLEGLPLKPFPVESVNEPVELPDAFALRVVLSGTGELRLLDGVIGPSGARAFGRFCHASPELEAAVRAHLRNEEALAPDAVFAEVVHLPAPKGADVVTRPVLRNYEILYLGRSGAPEDRQLSVDDLHVRMRDGWLQLWSKGLGKEVRPRLTSAHDFLRDALPLYSFLCLLQEDGFHTLVRPAPRSSPTPDSRWVCVSEPEGDLALDRQNPQHAALAEAGTLVEQFPQPQDMPVTGPEGHFAHEVILPFVRRAPRPPRTRAVPRLIAPPEPGGEPDASWLYLKLYCGVRAADSVLLELVAPIATEQWFFVRYADPFPHLRVRFKGRPSLDRLKSSPLLWKVEEAAYVPERARYPDLALAERMFWQSSQSALSVLHLDPDARWKHALARVDGLLSAAGLSLQQKRTLTRAARDHLSTELGISKDLLSPKFRAMRGELASWVDTVNAASRFTDARGSPTDVCQVAPGVNTTGLVAEEQASVRAMALDLAHMDVNRILQNNPRPQELVIYDFLARLYDSAIARSAKQE